MWQTNEVVKFDGKLYRILLVLPGEVVWICLESETAQPEYVHELTLNSFIDDSRLFRHDDPLKQIIWMSLHSAPLLTKNGNWG